MIVRADAVDKVATRFVLPADSSAVETSLIEIVGAASSSVIVIVAVPDDELTVALVGEDKATVKVSFASSIVSAKIGMDIVCVVTLGAKVKVPVVAE